ncbi:prenyltransferase [candidate division KSB1 bacterium]|nr:prenyltransferase [candidate division KSB1 bacterium]
MKRKANFFLTWWQAFRYHFVPPSFLPAILGSILAWAIVGKFNFFYFFLTVIGVTINHIALNMTDDYYDYIQSVDQAKFREKNPYSGGSGTLTSGLIHPRKMFRAFMICYLITAVIGISLTVTRGWPVFAIGAFGIICSYFYTAPPIRYGYHTLGELSQLVNFSLTIGLGAFFIQAQDFVWEATVILLPLGFMMFSMITINEIPDETMDRAGGKKTLVVRFGAQRAVWFYGSGMLIAFLIIIFAPVLLNTTYWIYLSLITFPWFIQAFRILQNNYQNPVQMAPANILTIRIHNTMGFLLILAYIIQGTLAGKNYKIIWISLVFSLFLYLPVLLTIFFNVLSIKPAEQEIPILENS